MLVTELVKIKNECQMASQIDFVHTDFKHKWDKTTQLTTRVCDGFHHLHLRKHVLGHNRVHGNIHLDARRNILKV